MSRLPDPSKWPAGATHWHPAVDGFVAHWVKVRGDETYFCVTDFEHEGWKKDVKYRAPIKHWIELKPVVDGWAGEGPPPVGHTCQVAPHNTLWGFSVATTYVCTILAYHGEFVWLDIGLPGVPVATRIDKVDFWAIRTPEQIAEEEKKARVAELTLVIQVSGWESPEILAAYLDSHGYCKKVSP